MIFREGFWAKKVELSSDMDEEDDGSIPLVSPVHSSIPWAGKRRFLAALTKAEDAAILTGYSVGYRCMSTCRCCRKSNGSSEFQVPIGNDNMWCWPSGFMHYIEVHNVRPSQAFIDFILDYSSGL